MSATLVTNFLQGHARGMKFAAGTYNFTVGTTSGTILTGLANVQSLRLQASSVATTAYCTATPSAGILSSTGSVAIALASGTNEKGTWIAVGNG